MLDEGDEDIFLVDFDRKVSDESRVKSEMNEKFETDEFGNKIRIKNEITEEEYTKQMKEKWEEEIRSNYMKDTIRYQDIKFDGL
jgi:hypothetical protein